MFGLRHIYYRTFSTYPEIVMYLGRSHAVIILLVVSLTLMHSTASEVNAQTPPSNLDRDFEVIFDDFVYANAEACPIAPMSCSYGTDTYSWDSPLRGSIFGINQWDLFEGPGISRLWTNVDDQGWYRYNWQNHVLSKGGGITVSGQQTVGDGVRLSADVDFEYVSSQTTSPLIRSGFERLTGTRAARIKLSDIDTSQDALTQAFWLFSSLRR